MFQQAPSSPHQHQDRMLSSPSSMPGHAPTFTGLNNFAELTPGDSASVVHDNTSTVSSHTNNTFSFKFNYGNKTHRFRHDIGNFQGLVEVIQQKIMVEHLSLSQSYVAVGKSENGEEEDWLTIAYLDDENDQVLMTCDSDLADSVQLARKAGQDRVRLFVHDTLADAVAAEQQLVKEKEQEEQRLKEQQQLANSIQMDVPVSQPTTLAYQQMESSEDLSEIKEEEEEEEESEEEVERLKRKKKSRSSPTSRVKKGDISTEYNLPIPQDMLLPAAITFLGVVILGVFTISKLTSSSSSSRY